MYKWRAQSATYELAVRRIDQAWASEFLRFPFHTRDKKRETNEHADHVEGMGESSQGRATGRDSRAET